MEALILLDSNRRKPNVKNRADDFIESKVLAMALDVPAYGQTRVSNEIRKQGIVISPGGVLSYCLSIDPIILVLKQNKSA